MAKITLIGNSFLEIENIENGYSKFHLHSQNGTFLLGEESISIASKKFIDGLGNNHKPYNGVTDDKIEVFPIISFFNQHFTLYGGYLNNRFILLVYNDEGNCVQRLEFSKDEKEALRSRFSHH